MRPDPYLRSVAFHKRLTVGVPQNAALGAGRLGQQDAGVREPGGVELHKFDVLQLQTGGQGQGHAVAGQIPGI